MEKNYRQQNFESMTETIEMCKKNPTINAYVRNEKKNQSLIIGEPKESLIKSEPNPDQEIIISNKRTFEAAKPYALNKDLKVAVLNFANAHTPGGAPFYAGAQEEVLCRCSTLYPCILEFQQEFYQKHIDDYKAGIIDWRGTDDIIYTPDVYVFKDDTKDEAPLDDPFFVDVITCAAPEFFYNKATEAELQTIYDKRARHIIAAAERNRVDVLILGAFGCGAFCNPPNLVAKAFKKAIQNTSFKKIEFAIFSRRESDDGNIAAFRKVFENN